MGHIYEVANAIKPVNEWSALGTPCSDKTPMPVHVRGGSSFIPFFLVLEELFQYQDINEDGWLISNDLNRPHKVDIVLIDGSDCNFQKTA